MTRRMFNLVSFLLIFFIIKNEVSAGSSTIVEASKDFDFFCDIDTYYIIMKVSFSSVPEKNYYPFTMTLTLPFNLNFKCMLQYEQSRIYCFSVLTGNNAYIEKNSIMQLPYQFPKVEGIIWDYKSFIKQVYRKVWTSTSDCGIKEQGTGTDNTEKGEENNLQNLNNQFSQPKTEIVKVNLPGTIKDMYGEHCGSSYKGNIKDNFLSFDMEVALESKELLEIIGSGAENGGKSIEFLQEIWIPLLPSGDLDAQGKKVIKAEEEQQFTYAFCSAPDKLENKNMNNFILKCNIIIPYQFLFKGNVRVASFYDKVFIKIDEGGKTIDVKDIKVSFIIPKPINFEELDQNKSAKLFMQLKLKSNAKGILCPNKVIFTIDDKDTGIKMGTYYPSNMKYTFALKGTLTNGYAYQDDTMVQLNQTLNRIQFNLTVIDNLIGEEDEEDSETIVDCVLSTNTLFNEKDAAEILCLGSKKDSQNKTNNIDITLNWASKVNNNFDDIIIKWPSTFDIPKKNIYSYELTGISMKQSNYGCFSDSFNFYVYIYDLGKEPKLSFDLNLYSPKSPAANCEIFDSSALKCSLNLKYSRLSAGSTISLPYLGAELTTVNNQGNSIKFTMNNFTQLDNPHDFYITVPEACGKGLLFGTFGGMGLSKGATIAVVVIFLAFIAFVIGFAIYYIIWRVKFTYKRDKKLTLSEESKTGYGIENTMGAKK